jgi:PAS domain S-box-containing protein
MTMQHKPTYPAALGPLFDAAIKQLPAAAPGQGMVGLAAAAHKLILQYQKRQDIPADESKTLARNQLADLGFGFGATDAEDFIAAARATDPGVCMAAGLIQLGRRGWAEVVVAEESKLTASELDVLVLDLRGSVEAEAHQGGADHPVCVLAAGYIAGWGEVAMGQPIAATEILCRGKADDRCRFVVCRPAAATKQIAAHLGRHPDLAKRVTSYEVPRYFAGRLAQQREAFEELVRETKERTADLMMANKILQAEVAERKIAEAALRESEARYRQLFNSVSDGVLLFEIQGAAPHGGLIEVNDVLCKQLGQEREAVLTRDPRTLIGPGHRQNFEAVLQRLEQEQHVLFDSMLVDGSGQKIPVELHAHVFELSGRRVALLTSRDITERRRAAEEQARLTDQLSHSQKMEAIGQLSGGIAHDFNNLLTAIMSNAELLLQDVDAEDPLYEPIEEIMQATERAARLTKRLLIFSRRQVLKPVTLNLNDLISGLEARLRRLIGSSVELHLALDKDLGHVTADTPNIEQIVVHLVTNACDAMPQGGKLILETRNVELDDAYARRHLAVKPGSYVLFAVSDTGEGIAPESLPRLFDPFFSGRSAPDRAGLGLSITYGVVKQSNGNIWAYSEPGAGTTFKIYLPRLEGPEHHAAVERQREAPQHGSETILLVEDEDLIRSVASRILRKGGFHILEAANGPEAIELCEQFNRTIDLLVTDIMMPRMNGRELSLRLRELRPSMRVLYMSGFTSDVLVQQELLDQGMSFLEKPFTPTILLRKVREALDRSG